VDGCGLLPVGSKCPLICCPLVFSPTRWAIRSLTPKELLGVFDWPESLLPVLPETPAGTPFVKSAPGRLLSAILSTISRENQPRIELVPPAKVSHTEDAPHWPNHPGTEWHGILESTTTADDNQAHTVFWDQRILQKFSGSDGKVKLFERSQSVHPLDVFRDFLMRM
jgi:hypothetical protein